MTEETQVEVETKEKAKRVRKPVKKFFIHHNNRVITGLVASEVAGFLSANESVFVYDQVSDHDFDLNAPTVNDKFKPKTVIEYNA